MRRKETGYIKYLTEPEFKLILKEANQRKSKPFLICLKFMAYLGLRVSDATILKTENLNPELTELTYTDKKTKTIQSKRIPPFFRKEIKEYTEEHKHLFRNNYLFPPLHNKVSKNNHLQTSTFRDFFKKFRQKYGYDKPYYVCNNGKPLYRISTHTLKHYCLYKVFKASGNDMSFTQTFSGHKEIKHTFKYILTLENRARQEEILEKAFT